MLVCVKKNIEINVSSLTHGLLCTYISIKLTSVVTVAIYKIIFMIAKAKAVPLHAIKALRVGGEEVSFYSFSTSALDGVNGQRHAPAAL